MHENFDFKVDVCRQAWKFELLWRRKIAHNY